MIEERLRLPDVSPDENALINSLLEQLRVKHQRNLFRASLYDGKHAIRANNTIIPPYLYKLGIVLGWSAKAVDMLARRCNPAGVIWPNGDLDGLGFKEYADANQLSAQIKAGLVSSLIHGVSFLVNTRGDVQDDEPASLLHVKEAMNATGEWNNRRRRLDNLLSITSRDENLRTTGLVLYLDGVTISADRTGGRKWQVERSEHIWGVPAEPLVYKPRPGREFGASRISRPLISIHERALRAVVRMEGHMDIFSIPQLILLGADESIFKNPDGSMKASWQIALGRVFGIPDDDDAENPRADVKQFQASSPTPHTENLKELAGEFSGEASIPLTSLGVSDQSNPTSADSYIASREDLIAEAEGATDDWSLPLRRSIARGLAIQNGVEVDPRWSTIEQKWRSPVYLSRAAQADAGAKQLAAVPWLADTQVGLELLGLDEQQIRAAMGERAAAERRAAGRQVLASLAAPTPPPDAVPSESRAALRLVTSAAVTAATKLVAAAPENASDARLALLEGVPAVIAYYADGSAALAADFYDDEREAAAPRSRFTAEPVVTDREEKVRRAIAWSAQPWFEKAEQAVAERLADVVQIETARPYRDTITVNSERDPSSIGWRRISSGGCKFCRMLAGRGAVYKESTARFASHTNCHCSAQPVFDGEGGEEASVIQYIASKRKRSDADRKRLRDYLASMPD